MEHALSFVGGLGLLIAGAQLLVSGAVQIARRLGVSSLLIGLLIGFGTSTPELVTSVQGAFRGSPGVALGNVVGSNIANLLLVLGACALLRPIQVESRALKFDGVVVVCACLLFALLSLAAPLSRPVGAIYLILLAAYVGWSIKAERRRPKDRTAPLDRGRAGKDVIPVDRVPRASHGLTFSLSLTLGGLVMILTGAEWVVDAAMGLAQRLHVSESAIGLTLVALGTSLPELATSTAATLRRNADVTVGNLFGSSIYNVLGITGVTALLSPTEVPAAIAHFGNAVMCTAAVAMFAFAWTGYRISRREGIVMLALYATYIGVAWHS